MFILTVMLGIFVLFCFVLQLTFISNKPFVPGRKIYIMKKYYLLKGEGENCILLFFICYPGDFQGISGY